MAEEQKKWVDQPGKGSMFINDFKKSDSHADYKGNLLVNLADLQINPDKTVNIKISAWIRAKKDGGHLLSLSQDRPYEKNMEAKGGFRKTEGPMGLMNSRKDKEIKFDEDEIPF